MRHLATTLRSRQSQSRDGRGLDDLAERATHQESDQLPVQLIAVATTVRPRRSRTWRRSSTAISPSKV